MLFILHLGALAICLFNGLIKIDIMFLVPDLASYWKPSNFCFLNSNYPAFAYFMKFHCTKAQCVFYILLLLLL